MKEEKKEFKSKYLLLALFIMAFMVVSIGSTFSFFTAYIKGNDKHNHVHLETPDIMVNVTGTDLSATGIFPGWKGTMEVVLENVTEKNNVPGVYSLNWEIITNEIENDELEYSISCIVTDKHGKKVKESKRNKTINKNNISMPTVSSTIGKGVINSGHKHTCTITLHFLETEQNQDNNQGKKFFGKVVTLGEQSTFELED